MGKFNKNQSGQAALEAAIILIAFVVVASVFAFAVLSAGTASTQKGEQAIYAGLQGVQSSMEIKGAVIAEANAGKSAVNDVVFTVSLVAGGDPINLASSASNATGSATPDPNPAEVVIAYRDNLQSVRSVPFFVDWIVNIGAEDDLLEAGEIAEIKVFLKAPGAAPFYPLITALGTNTAFTLEIKPPTGSVIALNRTTPAALEAVMELR